MNKIITGNAIEVLKELPDCTVDCCITSPPYTYRTLCTSGE